MIVLVWIHLGRFPDLILGNESEKSPIASPISSLLADELIVAKRLLKEAFVDHPKRFLTWPHPSFI